MNRCKLIKSFIEKRLINMMRKSSDSQEHFSPDGGQESSMESQIVILRVSKELEMASDNLITKQTLKISRYWDPLFNHSLKPD